MRDTIIGRDQEIDPRTNTKERGLGLPRKSLQSERTPMSGLRENIIKGSKKTNEIP